MTNQDKWILYCATHDTELSIFNKPFWLDAVCNGRNHWDVFLVEENGEIEAALPYFKKKRMGFGYITMPKLTPYSGIWLNPAAKERKEKPIAREYRLYKLLIEQIEASRATIYQQCFSTEVKNWQPFYWSGYNQETLYTFSIDSPHNLEDVERNFAKSTRHTIRRASQACTISEFDDIALFYQLNCMVYTRKNQGNPVSRHLVEQVYSACRKQGAVKMLGAKNADGVICSALFLVHDAKTVYSLMCGSLETGRDYNYLTALEYEGIKFACETGRNYDFEGSMMEGVANYNRMFGAKMRPYYSIKKVFDNKPILSQYLKYKVYA